MPQMAPILWNLTSFMSFFTLLFMMSNFIFPMKNMKKKNMMTKKKKMLLTW